MKDTLFPFQKIAVDSLRVKAAEAIGSYNRTHAPQVISFTAPTGSGKTIIMSSLIEDIFFGTDDYIDQPDAIFVWLSDSPQLNEQSKQKIDLKADKIRLDQCVTITDESFDQEMLDDGHIYFLNTQKIGKKGNLTQHSDERQYTIWETLQNTAENKSDRLYFIIDEAHRGMQGREAGKATSIMQRFLKGYPKEKLSAMPVVIGMSATTARFNNLIEETPSTVHKVIVSAQDVRASGLLKERIFITYPKEATNDMAILQAAVDEWLDKCVHWYQYTYEQHYTNVNPVLVVQVQSGTGKAVSDTNLNDCLAKIEERVGIKFKENEVVHTFGDVTNLTLGGLNVPHIDPTDITDDRRIKVVFFKENLSTGWDCPRAETMMSFRHATDATYIAQLLGRMVRTPLQCHVQVDESLNDVHLYLPYFDSATVERVVDELQNTEGGEIPTYIEGEEYGNSDYIRYTVKPKKKITPVNEDQISFVGAEEFTLTLQQFGTGGDSVETPVIPATPQQQPTPQTVVAPPVIQPPTVTYTKEDQIQMAAFAFDREKIIKFINDAGFTTYKVRDTRINSYVKSMIDLAYVLTISGIYPNASDDIIDEIVKMIHDYVEELKKQGKYDEYAQSIQQFKLYTKIFDIFGESVDNDNVHNTFMSTDSDLDRQLRIADGRLGNCGVCYRYGSEYVDNDYPNLYKIDVIMFTLDDDAMNKFGIFAENKFHELDDQYRIYVINKSDRVKRMYEDVVKNGDAVSKHNFSLPETRLDRLDKDGKDYDNHLYVDEETGLAKISLNNWEKGVLEEESKRNDFVCWLRNPPRKSWSLCVKYEMGGETKAAYPDFLIVRADPQLKYVIDVLEPHGADFADNLAKAKGLADYAKENPKLGRVQMIREGKDPSGKKRFIRLDLAKSSVRAKVKAAQTVDEFNHIFETDGIFE